MWIFGGRNSGLFVRFGKEIEYIYIYIYKLMMILKYRISPCDTIFVLYEES